MRCMRWIYQDRPTERPWAVLLSVEKRRRRYTAHAAFYADWLNTPERRIDLGGFEADTPRALVEKVGGVCNAYTRPLLAHDVEQLCAELHDMRKTLAEGE